MVIQGTQVPMYTNTDCFCIFLIFQFFFNFYIKNKINKTKSKQNMLNKAKHNTKLTQNLKAKHTSNAHTKTRREKEKSDRITWSLFPSTPWKNLSFD